MQKQEITEEIVKGVELLGGGANGFNQETIEKTYDAVADQYEKLMVTMGHPDPEQCGEMALSLLGSDLSQMSALDMGCGTGMVGAALKVRGVAEIIGIDASAGMIEIAKQKNCYDQIIHMYLGKPSAYPAKLRSRFDIITAAAILAEGHLGVEVFDEMIHSLKRGGYAIFTTREMYLDKYNYRHAIEELERRGFWKKVKESKFQKYQNIEKGTKIGRYETVDVMIYAYKKL
jgi:predicted TPR repeat methyltransferase